MPQPTLADVHVDAILTNISTAYMLREDMFVASQVFPTVPVEKKTDKYYTYTKNDWFRDQMKPRAPATESAGSGFGLSTGSYSADVWALHKDIDDQVRANTDNPINLDADTARWLTQMAMIRRERQWTTDYFATAVWDTDKVGGTDFTLWSNFGSSNPIIDVTNGRLTILQNTGHKPNTLVVGVQVHEQLKQHPLIMERAKVTSKESVTKDLLARVFEVDRYLVGESVYATNEEGGTAAYAFIIGKSALLAYAAPAPGLLVPSAGYTFVWRGLTNLNRLGTTISTMRAPLIKSDRIEIEMAFDLKVVATDLGYFFSAAVA